MASDRTPPDDDETEKPSQAEPEPDKPSEEDHAATLRSRYEITFGLLLALFAAVLALNELGGGKYGDDELRLATEKTGAYLWYQSKGIKESLAEGQRDLLQSLVDNGGVNADHVAGARDQIAKLGKKIERYGLEKDEILLGSAKVGEAHWAQEVDGKLGKITGVKELEATLEVLGTAGDRFDLATLFLQLCLVIGAIGLIMKQLPMKRAFLGGMVALGLLGATFTVLAYHQVGLF